MSPAARFIPISLLPNLNLFYLRTAVPFEQVDPDAVHGSLLAHNACSHGYGLIAAALHLQASASIKPSEKPAAGLGTGEHGAKDQERPPADINNSLYRFRFGF